jgi:hypothetical protein
MSARVAKIKQIDWSGLSRVPAGCCLAWFILLGPMGLLAPTNASAARVADLYGGIGLLPEGQQSRLNSAFDGALSQVLVKVTGLPEMGSRAARTSLFTDSAGLVQQYSMLPDDEVRVEFDSAAILSALDRAGQPVWGIDRPLVVLWLAVDAGGGQRVIVSEGSQSPFAADADGLEDVRKTLSDAAAGRGLPVALPLADAEDRSRVSFSDIWGDFRAPVVDASERYGAGAVLIGRARSLSPDQQGVRWTLVVGSEQTSWQGDLPSGPGYAAEFLAKRLATYANSAGSLRVLINNVTSLDAYGQIKKYFGSLNIVESYTVSRVDADRIEFELIVRGDVQRLSRTLDSSRLMRPVPDSVIAAESVSGGRSPDLVYTWSRDR